jgi:fibro-slime domain-containing protein
VSEPATVHLRVNRPPVADAGVGHAGQVGTLVQLNGNASSDPDGDSLHFQWTFSQRPGESTTVLQDATTATPAFVVDVAGTYRIQLMVSDGHGGSATALVTITVTVPNRPPVITSTPVTTGTVGQVYSYDAEATDPDGDALTFALSTAPTGMTIETASGVIAWTPMEAQVSTHDVVVQVQDGAGGSDEQRFTVTVLPENHPPRITSTPVTHYILPPIAGTGDFITLEATIRDVMDSHPDFEDGISGFVQGLVQPTLEPDRTPVFAGPNGRGAITSADTFHQWYHDVPGVNATVVVPLVLTETSPGSKVFAFNSGSFFPIDGQLLGNQGRGHNYHFTVALHTGFTYRGGEVFQFTGDDDVWVFINNTLVVNLGGVHGAVAGSVNLDTLGFDRWPHLPLRLLLCRAPHQRVQLFFADRRCPGTESPVPLPGAGGGGRPGWRYTGI